MKKIIYLLLLILSLDCYAQTATEILDKYFEAVGGRKSWEGLESYMTTTVHYSFLNNEAYKEAAKISTDTESQIPKLNISQSIDTLYVKYPNQYAEFSSRFSDKIQKTIYRREFFNGMTIKYLFDGSTMLERNKAQDLISATKKITHLHISQELLFDRLKMKYVGQQVFRDSLYEVLSHSDKYKQTWYYYFDIKDKLLKYSQLQDNVYMTLSVYEDYQTFGSLKIPCFHETYIKGSLLFRAKTIHFEPNIQLKDSFFEASYQK